MFIFFYVGLFTTFRYMNTPLKNREKLPAKYFFLTIFGDQLNYAKTKFFPYPSHSHLIKTKGLHKTNKMLQ